MAVNAKVVARRDSSTGQLEAVDVLLRRFKKEIIKSGVLDECKRREYFRSKKETLAFKHDLLMKKLKNKKYKVALQMKQD